VILAAGQRDGDARLGFAVGIDHQAVRLGRRLQQDHHLHVVFLRGGQQHLPGLKVVGFDPDDVVLLVIEFEREVALRVGEFLPIGVGP
jgi:hypothetical protein